MLFRIPLLQRFLFGEVLRVFVFVLFCISVLLVFVGIFQQATDSGLDPIQALKIIPYVVPSMLPFTIPSALLLTVSVVYGRLAGDQELTAAKAAGIHPLSLMWPALLLGGVLSVCSLLLTDQVIPWSMAKIEQQIVSFMEDIFLDRLRTEHHFSDPRHGLLVTVEGVDGHRLIHPTFRYTKGQKVCTLQADEATLDLDIEGQKVVVTARNGWIDIPGQTRGRFSGTPVREEIRWENAKRGDRPRELPIVAIQQEIQRIEHDGARQRLSAMMLAGLALAEADFDQLSRLGRTRLKELSKDADWRHRLNTEQHSRYALSCSCFFFALLGTPFSMRFGKSQYLTSFLMCFLPIVCGYYPLVMGITTQAKKGAVDPLYWMWLGNLLLAAAAAGVYRRVVRH